MYRVTITQGANNLTYADECLEDVASLIRILLFEDSNISINVQHEYND